MNKKFTGAEKQVKEAVKNHKGLASLMNSLKLIHAKHLENSRRFFSHKPR